MAFSVDEVDKRESRSSLPEWRLIMEMADCFTVSLYP